MTKLSVIAREGEGAKRPRGWAATLELLHRTALVPEVVEIIGIIQTSHAHSRLGLGPCVVQLYTLTNGLALNTMRCALSQSLSYHVLVCVMVTWLETKKPEIKSNIRT